MDRHAVVVENLTFRYKKDAAPVLNNISFSLPAGSRTLLIGLNGCGKSTLMRILTGHYPLTAAATKSVDSDSHTPPRVELGRHRHRPHIDADLLSEARLLDNTGFHLASQDTVGALLPPPSDSRTSAARRRLLMSALHLDPRWRLTQLSDGMRRRAQLTHTIQHAVPLFLMDEADEGLDPVFRRRLLRILAMESRLAHRSIHLPRPSPKRSSVQHQHQHQHEHQENQADQHQENQDGQDPRESMDTTRDAGDVDDAWPPAVIFATHYFAGLEDWPTHVLHLRQGKIVHFVTFDQANAMAEEFVRSRASHAKSDASPFVQLMEGWMQEDYDLTDPLQDLDLSWP
eukprot:TRINITY_DN7292_c1_g2_i1.p1 TRINITY_DN7292_c1_g2~~TRINITY_DN7292_c1_g2_i1.p1  ORF type:complete len:343 (+),score=71.60 TRINITY_DN7292_c1_g2_i1:55-1083(+)